MFKKNIKNNNTSVYIFLKKNKVLTRKSKNSRMGKGKGKFFKWQIFIKKSNKLLFLKFLNNNKIKKLGKNI